MIEMEPWHLIAMIISIITLLGTIEWRGSSKRAQIYIRLDATKKLLREELVRKDVNQANMKHQDDQITELKKELDIIKTQTALLPGLQHHIQMIMAKLEINAR